MKHFFLFCSGANLDVLNECPDEQGKYAGIGATVFATAVLACLSGGYAFFTIFRAVPWAAVFGILWGLMIFNLDRVIVSSMRRQENWLLELATASPRLILAVFIGIVIAFPLELKFYERELNSEIARWNNVQYNNTVRTVDSGFARLTELEQQNAALQREIDAKQNEVDAVYAEAIGEAEGTAGTRRLGRGPVFAEKWDRLAEVKQELATLVSGHQARIQRNDREIARLRTMRQRQIDATTQLQVDADGILARMEALERLGRSSATVRTTSLFISLLFICVEISPVLVKLMVSRHKYRPYEQKLEDREMELVETSECFRQVVRHKLAVQAQQRISDFNDDINSELQLRSDQNQKRRDLQLRANEELMQRIADAQVEIASQIVDAWKHRELEKVERDPQRYIS